MDQHHTSAHALNPDGLGHRLHQDHERLDRLFQDLLCAFEADARTDVARLWNEFDTDLRAHMLLEEERLLPGFAEYNAPEALALLREHERLRDQLLQLGVGVDLHLTRHRQVEEFVRELRTHAKREEDLMYRWSQQQVHDANPQALLGRLAATP